MLHSAWLVASVTTHHFVGDCRLLTPHPCTATNSMVDLWEFYARIVCGRQPECKLPACSWALTGADG
jgi:hypothetical protein